MPFSKQYVRAHENSGVYITESQRVGYSSFNNRNKWVDHIICDDLVYSHRVNHYTRKTFTEGLHTHEYYELIIYVSGDVEYVKEETLIRPMPYSVLWFSPGQMHTARLVSDSNYERYVFYFSEDLFRFNGTVVPMIDFIKKGNTSVLHPDIIHIEKVKEILKNIQTQIGAKEPFGGLLVKAYITELFAVFNKNGIDISNGTPLSDDMMRIKKYIDTEYAALGSVSDIADRFHYSREHLSRKFKESFNISIAEYISKRRVLESLPLLHRMRGAEAAYAVGFKSQSSYIAAFVKNMGQLPSEYKKLKTQ